MNRPSSRPDSPTPRAETAERAYGSRFWLCYLANTCVMVAVSVLFRYADFVYYLGGTEMQLGVIVGVGMLGALVMRVAQGIGIDRYGPRVIWLLSLAMMVVSLLGHTLVVQLDAPWIYLARILLMIGVAGAFGASLTFISLMAPKDRMAEMIGMLGSSGFVGLALGPTLGDWLMSGIETSRADVNRMFYVAAAMAAVSFVFAAIASRGATRRPRERKQPSLLSLVRRYHPGPLLLVSIAMGIGIGMPHTFLKTFANAEGIARIKVFFLVYAATAFTVRILTRRWVDRVGVRPVILSGLFCLASSMLLYLLVWNEWSLAIPAVGAGIAHAFLFPAVVAGGSASFPTRYRGLATTLILMMFDIGNLVGQPTIGGIVHLSREVGLPPYPTMFVSLAVLLMGIGLVFAWTGRAGNVAGAAATSMSVQPRRRSKPLTPAPISSEPASCETARCELPGDHEARSDESHTSFSAPTKLL